MMQSHNKSNYRTMMGCLIINGKRYPVYEGLNTIGRCLTATVSLKSLDVSKQHAIITIVSENEHYLSDFQSFNGTYLTKSKLTPLSLYKISQDSLIEFANVTATYNQVLKDTKRDNGLDVFHSTQSATQSLYEANTQAVENEITCTNSTVNLDQQNYFDDDYSFDEISSQVINERERSNSPVFKAPLTINDAPTQKLCEDGNLQNSSVFKAPLTINDAPTQKLCDDGNFQNSSVFKEPFTINDAPTQELCEDGNLQNRSVIKTPLTINDAPTQTFCQDRNLQIAADPTDIHNMETQKLDITSRISIDNLPGVNDMPTQILMVEEKQDNYGPSSVIDETILDSSEIEVAQVVIKTTEVISEIQDSEDNITFKSKKKIGIIESDTETDIEDLDESTGNPREDVSGSDTDVEGLEKNITKPSSILNHPTSKSPILNLTNTNTTCTDSDTDIDDFEFNTQINSSLTTRNLEISENKIDDTSNDEIIPATQFLEDEFLNENLPCNSPKGVELCNTRTVHDKLVNSIDDMDSLYLEATQSITDSHIFTEPSQPFIQKSQILKAESSHSKQFTEVNEKTGNKNELTNPEKEPDQKEEGVFLKPLYPISKVNSQIKSTVLNDEVLRANESQNEDAVFLQPTQPMSGFDKILSVDSVGDGIFNQPTQHMFNSSQDIFMQPTQALESDLNAKQPACKEDSQDAVFLEPTQPVSKFSSQANANDEIFLQPTQPLIVAESEIVLKQPIPVNSDRKSVVNLETDDIYLESTQKLHLDEDSHINTERDIEKKLEKMFLSQNGGKRPQNSEIESQLEVVFESQNVSYHADVSYRPLNPLVNEFEGKVNVDSQNSETPLSMSIDTISKSIGETEDKETPPFEEQEGSKNLIERNKQRRSVLSLQKRVNDTEEDYVDGYHLNSTLPLEQLPSSFQNQTNTQNKTFENVEKSTAKQDEDSKTKAEEDAFIENLALIEFSQPMRVTRSRANNKTSKAKSTTQKGNKKTSVSNNNNNSGSEQSSSKSMKDNVDHIEKTKKKKGNTNETVSKRSKRTVNTPRKGNKNEKETVQPDNKVIQITSEELKPNSVKSHDDNVENVNHTDAVIHKKSKRIVKNKKLNVLDGENIEINIGKVQNSSTFGNDIGQESEDSVVSSNVDTGVNKNKRKSEDNTQENNSSKEEVTSKRVRQVSFEELAPTSRATRSKRVLDNALETPQKRREIAKTNNSHTPSKLLLDNSTVNISTPDRNRRKQKPKVVFTMLDSPELESVIRSLGGTVVNSVETCTVLVTGSLKRTPKLLSALGLSKPICSPRWLQESKKANQFLDPWDHILEDKDAESNWKLSLKQSLIKSQTQKLFNNYTVFIAVTNSVDALKAAIESCGGKCVTKAPGKITSQNFVVVASPENKSKYSKFLNRDPPIQIVLPEAIFDGVLRQELRFEDYLL